MPTLDVTQAFDASFWDDVTVYRITESMDEYGRAIRTKAPIATRAVVTPSSPADLQRLPDAQYMNKAITLYSPFRFQGPVIQSDGSLSHPDEILWHGSTFVVVDFRDWSGFGIGYTQTIAVSIQSVDGPPAGGGTPVILHAPGRA